MMPMQMTATNLRADLFSTLDQVLASGDPVDIPRPGGVVRIVRAATSRLANLQPHPGIVNGDPAELAELSWEDTWRPTL